MFNSTQKYCLFYFVAVFGLFVISACTESNNQSGYVTERKAGLSATNSESKLAEYIIVLRENVSITSAINNLQKYEAQVIRDLKKGRFLIGLKNDPGIEQLIKNIEGSEDIKQIQPNFTYTIQ